MVTVFFLSFFSLFPLTCMQVEIPRLNFFYRMHQVRATAAPSFSHSSWQYSQISGPRPLQRPMCPKKLRLSMTRILRSALPVSPTTSLPVAAATIFKLTCKTYSPSHSIMQCRSLSMFLLRRVERCAWLNL
ncbi:hypothetical protein BDR07DRAFT_387298 [Suillus spraguei]|nr:hypothetical protein BDR07DRAFT_387298 [Suillus spraguei]